MNRRALVVFVMLNIAISVGVAILVIVAWQSFNQTNVQEPVVQVFEVVVTATPGPTQTPWVVTVVGNATPALGGQPGSGEPTVAPTLNESILPDIATAAAATQSAIRASGSQEQTYTVQSGDNPSTIAQSLGVMVDDLLCANDLGTVDNPQYIYEGQVLIVPGPGFVCRTRAVEIDDEETPTPPAGSSSGQVAPSRTAAPTVTLAPTAENAQVAIVQVIGPGDVTSEGVVLENRGGLVDLQGWTLYDTEGNIFTFPDYRLFPGAGVTVFTRVGQNTPVALFWGQTRAVWQPGDVVSLANASGVVQSNVSVNR